MEKQVRLSGSNIKYEIVHRSIKYPRLEFKTGKLLLVLPENYNYKEKERELFEYCFLIQKEIDS